MLTRRATFLLLTLALTGEPGNSMLLYRIKDWPKHYEVSDSRKVDGPLSWVAVRTKQDGFGFRRMASERDRSDLLAAWILMVEIAARQRREDRGKLVRDGRPLTARSLATMTGFPEIVFDRALSFFSEPEQDWLLTEAVPDQPTPPAASARAEGAPGMPALRPDSPESPPSCPDASGPSGSTGQDRTGHHRTGQDPQSSSSPPASNDAPGLPGIDAGVNRNDPVPFVEVIAAFNELCPSLPRVRLNDGRKGSIRARWLDCKKGGEDPMPWFRLLFAKAEASDFLSGRKPAAQNRWRCGFDWLVSPTNAPKVMEGNYENRAGADVSIIGKRSSMA